MKPETKLWKARIQKKAFIIVLNANGYLDRITREACLDAIDNYFDDKVFELKTKNR